MESISSQDFIVSSRTSTEVHKSMKSSPPPKTSILIQCRRKPLLPRTRDEAGLNLLESHPKYRKIRIPSKHPLLHNNERRPCPSHSTQQKQSNPTSLRTFPSLFLIAAVLAVGNAIRFVYVHAKRSERSHPIRKDTHIRESQSSNTHPSVVVYLDDDYNAFATSPYPHDRLKHRKILDSYPAEHTDATQLYGVASSNDILLQTMERKFFPEHETNRNCVPMSEWQLMSFPNCNAFHETEMTDHQYIGSGNWRDTWIRESVGDEVIVKTINRYEHTFQERYFEFSRVDALAMERLTPNPYVMSIFGFCGMSVMTERGRPEIGFVVGKLKSRDKLIVAMQVAESIAAVHELDGIGKPASLVHNDININNIFWGSRGPLLNDFNIAVLMMKYKDTNESCTFTGHFPNPQWKAPEEQEGPDGTSLKQLNEKVDIYALGNLFFRFATANAPWREYASSCDAPLTSEEKKTIAFMKSVKRATPQIPKETSTSNDPYVKVLLKAMERCYHFNPEDRPTAREIVQFLNYSLEQLDGDVE
ncbi:hypothetical protein HJC23_010656 [Cyclotella cryptica]|uniref:Protein kinase domain-containing protein n=1 Tax=Cyclotella cryptica TaxID=29204 RepID=A0ABD3PEH2_9STRA